jgi:hypothetical protein
MARKIAVAGWNEWGEESLPKPIGKGKFITLQVIGSDARVQRLRVLSNEEFVHDPKTGDQFMIGPIDKPGKPDKKTGVIEPVLYDLWLEPEQQKQWILIGGRKKDEAIWSFLQKSSQFDAYEFRDGSVEAVLTEIDIDAPVKESLAKRKLQKAAEKYVESMSDAEIRAHFNDKNQDIELLRETLTMQAEENPAQFEEKVDEAQNLDVKSLVIDAEKAGIIEFDKAASSWSMDGAEIFNFPKKVGKGQGKHDQFVKYINEDDPDLFDVLIEKLS